MTKSPSRFGELADFLVGKFVRMDCSDGRNYDWVYSGTVIGCHMEAVTIEMEGQPITVVPWARIETIKVVDDGT